VDINRDRMVGVQPDISRDHSMREPLSEAAVEVSPSRFRIVEEAH